VNPASTRTPQQATTLNRQKVEQLAAAQLADSGVTPAEFDMLGIRCVMPDDPVLRRMRVAPAPGILYRYYLPNNQPNGLQRVRYLRGYEPPDPLRPGKFMRYGHPAGKPEELYLPPFRPWHQIFLDTSQPLCFTEGWLKAVAGSKFLDLNFLAYDGIWNWGKDHRLLSIFNEILFAYRTVYLVNDRDVVNNPHSTRAENELARLLAERGADVRLCRWPASCKHGKVDDAVVLGGKNRRWFDRYMLKPAVVFDAATAQLTEGVPADIKEDIQPSLFVVPPMPETAMYGIARKITDRFGTPRSLTYPAVLTALSACRLPTTGETRSQLFCALLASVAGGKSVYLERDAVLVGKHTTVMDSLPVSDRGLLNALQQFKDEGTHHALMLVDEMVGLLRKANIEGSNLYSSLNSLWSKSVMSVTDKKGAHESPLVRLSLLGCLPCKTPAQFAEAFGSDAQLGFYSRCLFGLAVKEEPFVFEPLGEKPAQWLKELKFYGSAINMPAEYYAEVEKWKQASATEEQRERRENRLGELLLRVALVTSSANGDKRVTPAAFKAATAFIDWQEKIRAVYTPANFKSPYAQCMDMVLGCLEKAQGYVNWRTTCQNHNWYRREFSQYVNRIKKDLIEEGMLVQVPGMKGCYVYRKPERS